MNSAFKPFIGVVIIVLVIGGAMLLAPLFAPKEKVVWQTDLTAALKQSEQTNKPVLAYFTATWCGPCQTMKHTTFADADVEKALARYIPVKIDIDEHKDLVQQYSVNEGIPHFEILDSKGVVISDAEGRVKKSTGLMTADQFLAWLK